MSMGSRLVHDVAFALSHGIRQLMCFRRGLCFTCRYLPITCFVFQLLGLTLTKIKSEMLICRTIFGIVIYSKCTNNCIMNAHFEIHIL